jgi:hypothetical protein
MTKGEYPQSMRDTVGSRLPTFTAEQLKVTHFLLMYNHCHRVFLFCLTCIVSNFCLCSRAQLVVGSLDFVALNYYFPYVTSPGTMTDADTPSFFKDMNITR